jgi:hypothetical protein
MSIRSTSVRRGGLLTVLVALLALLLPTGSASAAASGPPTTYMGVFSGDDMQFVGCAADFPDITGTWRVTVRDDKPPLVSVQMFSAGKPHVQYGGNAWGMPWELADPVQGVTFKVTQPAMAPAEFSMTLVGDDLTYFISPYHAFGWDCTSGTITGTLTRTAS